MSGPWDRPSSDDPDAQWPSEDLGSSRASDGGREARESQSSPEPWGSGADGAPGWDDWPPAPPPPPDDYLVEEPLPPSSDPWAESWTDEDADAMLRAASEASPGVERWTDEPAPPTPPPDDTPPTPDRWTDASAGPTDRHPEVEDDSFEAAADVRARPRIEPWSPDADPWRIESEPASERLGEPEPQPEPEVRLEPEPEPEPEVRLEPERPAHADAEPPPRMGWPPAHDQLPDWLAEPPPPTHETFDADAPEPRSTEQPDGQATAVEPEAEGLEAAQVEPELRAADEPHGSFWSRLPWVASREEATEPDIEADAAEPEPQPDLDAEPESEPEAEALPPAAAPELTYEPDLDQGLQRATFDETVSGGILVDEADASEPEPEHASAYEPEPEPAPAYEPEPEPEVSTGDPWDEPTWPERAESTQVLPTSWSPSMPSERPRTGDLEPAAGPVRTTLADADLDDDLAAASTAEQAVPWLIGVILLLAGMVIVLLALIFAGDASLGGAGAASPSPSLAAVLTDEDATPTPTATPVPTVTAGASPTAEATPTPAPGPQYGPLEMVYQGRSAALAPIYLLRRDFTVEGDPAVLAQDGSLDVRRFAWAPDGTVGAGLLADVLVSIEPGTEKRRLGDGL
ncbi:MAG TPA: hypothetical protein VM253_08000, partial [Candidatus Limnocylindrales bacterium]|nr:hypothetical protein [Candidatus Limnocylindrales bacterium]